MGRTEHLAATSSMTKPEVLEVKMQEGLQILSSDSKTFCFSSSFSGTASMIRSQFARSAWSVVVVRRGMASSHCW